MEKPLATEMMTAVLDVFEGVGTLDRVVSRIIEEDERRAWATRLAGLTELLHQQFVGSIVDEHPDLSEPPDDAWDAPSIVQRHFELKAGVGVEAAFRRPVAKGGDYYCVFSIVGLSRPYRRYAWGIDEIQALGLAMQMAAARLYVSPEYQARELTWLGSYDLGLPVVDVIRELIHAPRH